MYVSVPSSSTTWTVALYPGSWASRRRKPSGLRADDHLRAGQRRDLVARHVDREVAVHDPAVLDRELEKVHRRRPDEAGDEHVGRTVEAVLRRGALLQDPVLEDGDAVGHRHRLDLVVGDVHRRDAETMLDLLDLGPRLHAELGIEVRQRLVHQEHRRVAHDRSSHRHTLTLPTRQVGRLAVEVLGEVQEPRRLLHAFLDLCLGRLLQFEMEPDVVADRHVRVQRIVLEDHRDVAISRHHR